MSSAVPGVRRRSMTSTRGSPQEQGGDVAQHARAEAHLRRGTRSTAILWGPPGLSCKGTCRHFGVWERRSSGSVLPSLSHFARGLGSLCMNVRFVTCRLRHSWECIESRIWVSPATARFIVLWVPFTGHPGHCRSVWGPQGPVLHRSVQAPGFWKRGLWGPCAGSSDQRSLSSVH